MKNTRLNFNSISKCVFVCLYIFILTPYLVEILHTLVIPINYIIIDTFIDLYIEFKIFRFITEINFNLVIILG